LAEVASQTIDQQLLSATTSYRDAKEVERREAERWQRLIVDAVEAGLPQKRVAELAGISPTRVIAIIARVDSQET
jgi:hypothetical protein